MADILEFKSSQLSLTLVRVYDADMEKVADLLEEKLAKAGRFLKGAPVVVDPACPFNSVQLAQVLELLRQHQMTPVGVRSNDPNLVEYAELCGLAVFKPNTTTKPEDSAAQAIVARATTASPSEKSTDTVAEPVQHAPTTAHRLASLRSGQLEKVMLNDVLVSGSINSGAELYAGGNITVLGSVRGRLHAGATGDRNARIIAKDFNPELVSISGVFLLSDDIPSLAKRGWVEVYLEQQTLKFHSLD
jgi:septum site-determining protein MinC